MVLKEPPTRPEAHIPSDSRNGDALWSLLKRCWANEPRERPKASDVAKIMHGFARSSIIGTEGRLKPTQRAQHGQATTKNSEAEKPKILDTVAEGTRVASYLVNAIKRVNREQESITTNLEVQECLATAKIIRKRLVIYIQLVEDEEIIGILLDANERIVAALELYDKLSDPSQGLDDKIRGDREPEIGIIQLKQRARLQGEIVGQSSPQSKIGQSSLKSSFPANAGPHPDLQELLWGGESSPNLQAPIQPTISAHAEAYTNSSDKEAHNRSPYQYGAEGSIEALSVQEEEDPFADPFADGNEVAQPWPEEISSLLLESVETNPLAFTHMGIPR
ncbi:putative actin patch assembly and actin polymerization protein [Ceratobasidium sp. 394]|nr:putative actin patch assembly and actin polymerization protein [Ceratobasidium sp. 394]